MKEASAMKPNHCNPPNVTAGEPSKFGDPEGNRDAVTELLQERTVELAAVNFTTALARADGAALVFARLEIFLNSLIASHADHQCLVGVRGAVTIAECAVADLRRAADLKAERFQELANG